jgi:putative transposase
MASRAVAQFDTARAAMPHPSIPSPEEEGKNWFTAAELAELALPGLPADKRSVNRRARDERWQARLSPDGEKLARKRAGRGGGTEFHLSLLPGSARLELAKRGIVTEGPQPAESAAASSWRWFEAQSAKVKREAERRAKTVSEIELLEESGLTRSAAVAEAARRTHKSPSTIWNWLKAAEGVARQDRLPALAPRRSGGGREAEIDAFCWNLFVSDYLRPSAPTLASCYDRTAEVARERGLSLPSEAAFRRRLKRDFDPKVIMMAREGEEAFRRSLPAQRRTVDHLHALELVNVDGHKFDVFVRTPEGKVVRPIMVAIQDVRSSKVLAWRLDISENMVQVRLAFADLFHNFGIPKGCVLDNGRAFASKWITGGAKTRFRFKITDEEPTGVLAALGIAIHWALPYRGQSKPIERAFRDMCDRIAKHPAMEGAYVGNSPAAKPENYGSRAIAWDEFLAHVDKGISSHNARLGRRGRDYRGRSFDEVFAESMASAPVGKATPEQLRMALLAAEQVTVDRRTGEVKLFGNRYWAEGCGALHGEKVTVRYDPDCLHSDIHLYGQDGRFLTSAELIQDTGFDTAGAARESAKFLAEQRKRIRAGLEAEQLLAAGEVARLQADAPEFDPPQPSVIRPVRHRGQTAAALKPVPDRRARIDSERESRVFDGLRIIGDDE